MPTPTRQWRRWPRTRLLLASSSRYVHMPSPRDPCNLDPPLTTLVRPQVVACEVLAAAVDAPKKKKQKKQVQPNAPTARARKAAERVALTAAKAREQAAEPTVAKARTAISTPSSRVAP